MVGARFKGFVWIEDIIKAIEASASSPVYSILKRPDEKYVTEKAYENPKFVEDVVREVAIKLKKIKGLYHARIEAENFESIHNHNAYAFLETDYNGKRSPHPTLSRKGRVEETCHFILSFPSARQA